MLSEYEKHLMQRCLAAVRQRMPGFVTRTSQLRMMAEVGHALGMVGESTARDADDKDAGANTAVIEAGTGTGKTLAYLLPGLVLAHLLGKPLIVSSSTIALQEQLLQKDLPALQKCLPFPFKAVLAKGRGRYVCTARLKTGAKDGNGLANPDDPDTALDASSASANPRQVKLYRKLAQALKSDKWSGDRDTWAEPIDDACWRNITTDSRGCLGSRCRDFQSCPFHVAREQVQGAQVIVVNHDLLLSAAAMEEGGVLPPLEQCMLVVDEAHGLPAKALVHCTFRHSVHASIRLLEDLHEWLGELPRSRLDSRARRQIIAATDGLIHDLSALKRVIGTHCKLNQDTPTWRFPLGGLPAMVQDAGGRIQLRAAGLAEMLEAWGRVLRTQNVKASKAWQELFTTHGFYLDKILNIRNTWNWMLVNALSGPPVARWAERLDSLAHSGDSVVCAAPICSAARLRELLWSRVGAAVVTSATLRPCGSFAPFLAEAGLNERPALRQLAVASPFDYAGRACLHIPLPCVHPRDTQAHTEEVTRRLREIIPVQQGTLVLFASGRQMNAVYASLPLELRRMVLMQGQMARGELIAAHKRRIDQGMHSALFGLASLSEGIDLPGRYCSHVVCAKLPFAVPDTPLEQARREWIESQGRSAFLEHCVPEVGIRLAQSVGRLLRTHEDSGTVTVLDPRLGTTHWGKSLLQGLPPFRIQIGT